MPDNMPTRQRAACNRPCLQALAAHPDSILDLVKSAFDRADMQVVYTLLVH